MTVKVLRDSIVVTKDPVAEKSAGGLFVAHAETKVVTGTVVAVGSGRITMAGAVVPLEVVVGDRVVFNKSMATEVTDNEVVFFVLREDAITCILQ